MRICWFTKEGIRTGGMKEDTYIYKNEGCDIDSVIKLSEKMRKEVRRQVVGSLG